MGISSMPSLSKGLKQILCSVLRFFGVRSSDPGADHPPTYYSAPCEPTVTGRFRSRFKPVWFGSGLAGRRRGAVAERNTDCRVCLARFTCPLCLTYLLGGGGVAPTLLSRWGHRPTRILAPASPTGRPPPLLGFPLSHFESHHQSPPLSCLIHGRDCTCCLAHGRLRLYHGVHLCGHNNDEIYAILLDCCMHPERS